MGGLLSPRFYCYGWCLANYFSIESTNRFSVMQGTTCLLLLLTYLWLSFFNFNLTYYLFPSLDLLISLVLALLSWRLNEDGYENEDPPPEAEKLLLSH